MKKKKLRKIILQAVPVMQDYLGLSSWRLYIGFKELKDGRPARCDADPMYRSAHLNFDHKQIYSEKGALDYLRHELLHVVLCNCKNFRQSARKAARKGSKPLLEIAWKQSIEMDLVAVERALDFMGRTPEWMAKEHE